MIFQLRSFGSLCGSKKCFERISDLRRHIDDIVEKTLSFRAENPEISGRMGWGKKISQDELKNYISILTIDPSVEPGWKRLLGNDIEIKNPYLANYTPPVIMETKDTTS